MTIQTFLTAKAIHGKMSATLADIDNLKKAVKLGTIEIDIGGEYCHIRIENSESVIKFMIEALELEIVDFKNELEEL